MIPTRLIPAADKKEDYSPGREKKEQATEIKKPTVHRPPVFLSVFLHKSLLGITAL